MTKLISELILKKDFYPFAYRLCFRNETSHTHFTKTILIRELKLNGLTIEIPKNICQKGHNLTLFFLGVDSDPKIKLPDSGRVKEAVFEVMAKVENLEINVTDPTMSYVDLNFTQFDAAGWKNILNLYAENQEELNILLGKQHDIRDKE